MNEISSISELIKLFGGGIGAVSAVAIYIVYRMVKEAVSANLASHDKVSTAINRNTKALLCIVLSTKGEKEIARDIASQLEADLK